MSKDFVLWGFHPAYCDGIPIKLTGGALRSLRGEQSSREREGFTCGIYAEGTAPTGLRLQAEQAKNTNPKER
jgi:hypothetical protein